MPHGASPSLWTSTPDADVESDDCCSDLASVSCPPLRPWTRLAVGQFPVVGLVRINAPLVNPAASDGEPRGCVFWAGCLQLGSSPDHAATWFRAVLD